MLRRHAIAAVAGGTLAAMLGVARSASAAKKVTPAVVHVERGARGTTLVLHAKNAPYPTAGGAYDDPTVMVYVPKSFRVPKTKHVDFVVHFHGHNTTAPAAMIAHEVREQLLESKQNAVLVAPQGPVNASEGDFGKLMKEHGLARLLGEVIRLVGTKKTSKTLGDASLASATGIGRVVVSAHSGGYRAAAAVAARGGVDLREIYLFDALYGELDAFARFAGSKGSGRKIVSFAVGGAPLSNGEKLAKELSKRGVDVRVESATAKLTRDDLVKGDGVFLVGHVSHGQAVHGEDALRDCLLASCLRGHDTASWHKDRSRRRGG